MCYVKQKNEILTLWPNCQVFLNNKNTTYRWVPGGFFQFGHGGLKCPNEIMWPIIIIIIALYLELSMTKIYKNQHNCVKKVLAIISGTYQEVPFSFK